MNSKVLLSMRLRLEKSMSLKKCSRLFDINELNEAVSLYCTPYRKK